MCVCEQVCICAYIHVVVHACELSLMCVSEAVCLVLSCVFRNLLLLQTVWGAEMVRGVGEVGSGHGGRPESIGSVMRWPGAR